MNFLKHSEIKGLHSFLSPSKHYWINYSEEKLKESYGTYRAQERGTMLHEFAAKCIELRQKLDKKNKTLNMYVNDCIKFNLKPEQPLYFSRNCFGTMDAGNFEDGIIKVSDYKSGTTPASMDQLKIYVAIMCLEYHINFKTDVKRAELRLYQNDDVELYLPKPEEIEYIINKIIFSDNIIESLRECLED